MLSAYEAQTKVNTEALLEYYGEDFGTAVAPPLRENRIFKFQESTGIVSGWGCDPSNPTASVDMLTAGVFQRSPFPWAR
ncbi:MAG: hypothetical protein R3A47_04230 [Polyangiales bacterium]